MKNGTITSLMTDTETFRQKVIDAGIRGKLTKQLPEDGNAEDLYQKIQEEKAKLVKEGKIKKSKPLPEIKPEEIPFEIPKNWKWVRLEEITYQIGNKNNEILASEIKKGENIQSLRKEYYLLMDIVIKKRKSLRIRQ